MKDTSRINRAAFDLAIEIASRDPLQRSRIEHRFAAGESFEQVGRSAAFHCQIVALNLMPWQNLPCFADARPGRAPWRPRC
jgi:hypothetical protein